jgi:sulfoxide reductase catalytic subunit YedY
VLIRSASEIRSDDVTDPDLYLRRREFIRNAALGGGVAAFSGPILTACFANEEAGAATPKRQTSVRQLEGVLPAASSYRVDEAATSYEDATTYNNFYELGTDKGDPARNAHKLRTEPWSVVVEGEVAKPGRVALEDLIAPHALEERIYRMRCVEAWSMVIPWVGISLGDVLRRFEPTSKARFVAFETLLDPEQLPGQRRSILDWPYQEGLRLDEAMHPLTILAVGMYGKTLPGQNGAPLRLVVPWKYGFKGIKSIVRIRLQSTRPDTSWNVSAPREYGFYANVNPSVDHPRWSQARERRIGEWRKRPTLPFNGYAEQVADLYRDMDLRKSF